MTPATQQLLQEILTMPPDQLQVELTQKPEGPLAQAFREASNYIKSLGPQGQMALD